MKLLVVNNQIHIFQCENKLFSTVVYAKIMHLIHYSNFYISLLPKNFSKKSKASKNLLTFVNNDMRDFSRD